MITDYSYANTMMSDVTKRSMMTNNAAAAADDFGDDLSMLVREQRRQEASERDTGLNIYRSGSAPPYFEGSLSAIGGLFDVRNNGRVFASEEELRADAGYVDYYYNNVNLNPRLPPPLPSKEEWRFAQRLQRGDDNQSLFSVQPGDNGMNGAGGGSVEWGEDGLIGLSGLELGNMQKNIAEIIQDDPTSASRNLSRTASHNAFDGSFENVEGQFAHLSNELASVDALHYSSNKANMSGVQNNGSSAPHTYASALGASLSRSTTPDPQLVARAPSPRIPPAGGGRANSMEKRGTAGLSSFNGITSNMSVSADIVAAMSNLSLSTNGMVDERNQLHSQFRHEIDDHHNFLHLEDGENQMNQQSGLFQRSLIPSANPCMKRSPSASFGEDSPSHYLNMNGNNSPVFNRGLSGYPVNPASPSMLGSQLGSGYLPHLFENSASASVMGMAGMDSRNTGGLGLGPNMMAAATELQNHSRVGNYAAGNGLQAPLMDPLCLQYLMSNDFSSAQIGALGPKSNMQHMSNSHMDLHGLQKAYLGTLISQQKSHRGIPYLGKSGSLNHGYLGNPAVDLGLYPGSPLGGPLLSNSPVGLGSPVRHSERNMRFNSMRNVANGVLGAWHSGFGGNFGETFGSSLLDEFKGNKARCFELSEIAGHVVEFSADQYGSRFIQQKLETATADEKNMVFHEIMPQALTLMTDVFGNYVIQKFFEHGTESQIRELADQLSGHVLSLSLQMYGCRVIQKAIEVVELAQQTNMVQELDGNIMRCVRDQNGNHVIQKCIECIPEEGIHFIISTFYDQVVTLSTHPYGCRVIQRVLEHCHDPQTQRIMMDEIMHSVCMLAQDQYGNYVVQHVLEHGKPHERSAIIQKLTGQIVQMSQQKFASNVIEKCLTFGTPEERQVVVNEMLGSTDDNEPLQVMMKDQFANYVVQKLLETCDDQQLELILNRIKDHLNALKKYTYGKHIVARVEKLVAAGERRIGIQTTNPA